MFLRTQRGAQPVLLVWAHETAARRVEAEKSRCDEQEGTMMHIGRVWRAAGRDHTPALDRAMQAA